jgi:histone deacetylase complex regulatory component SIN3
MEIEKENITITTTTTTTSTPSNQQQHPTTLSFEETKRRYDFFVSSLIRLMNGAIDQLQFEDECRLQFGVFSYVLFTIDRLVRLLMKQVNFKQTNKHTL